MSHQNQEDHVYNYIEHSHDDHISHFKSSEPTENQGSKNKKPRKIQKPADDHSYEHLRRDGRKKQRAPERLEMAQSEVNNQQTRSCKMPPWWGWLIIVIGIGILCVMATLSRVSNSFKCKQELLPTSNHILNAIIKILNVITNTLGQMT